MGRGVYETTGIAKATDAVPNDDLYGCSSSNEAADALVILATVGHAQGGNRMADHQRNDKVDGENEAIFCDANDPETMKSPTKKRKTNNSNQAVFDVKEKADSKAKEKVTKETTEKGKGKKK